MPPVADDVNMGGVDRMDLNGMVDDDVGQEFACRACKRMVCEICAVVETGAGRECLGCRTSGRRDGGQGARTHWVGGIGWMP